MTTLRCILSGAVVAPSPVPFRPPKREGDMPWDEALDRHRHQLARERAARAKPWTDDELGGEIDRAVGRLMALQQGRLDLLDEGRLGEDEPARALARLIDGVELEPAVFERREWIAEADPPRLVRDPVLRERRALRRRWERAQAYTTGPVKLSLLGPRSFAGAIDDAVHGVDVDAGAEAIAEALNPGLRELGEGSCPAVELVEPALLAAAPGATARGFESVARVLHQVPRETERWLRLVPADGVPPWLGAPPPGLRFASVAEMVAALPIDGVVLERGTAVAAADVFARSPRLKLAVLAVDAEARDGGVAEAAAEALAGLAAVTEPGRVVAAVDGGGPRARAPLAHRLGWLAEAVRAVG